MSSLCWPRTFPILPPTLPPSLSPGSPLLCPCSTILLSPARAQRTCLFHHLATEASLALSSPWETVGSQGISPTESGTRSPLLGAPAFCLLLHHDHPSSASAKSIPEQGYRAGIIVRGPETQPGSCWAGTAGRGAGLALGSCGLCYPLLHLLMPQGPVVPLMEDTPLLCGSEPFYLLHQLQERIPNNSDPTGS